MTESKVNWDEVAATATDTGGVIPDHTKSRDDKPFAERIKAAADKTRLGANKATRSPVRQLTEEDREKIATFYGSIALLCAAPTPLQNVDAADAIANQADACADAWFRLAKNNDSVRRAILVFIEGGDWGALVVAHIPILMAFMPQHVRNQMWGMFARPDVPDTPEGI